MIKAASGIAFSLLLFAESLVPQGEWSELCKIPALIRHFKIHQMENSSIGFIEFLALHYDDTRHHEEDHQEHHNLPLSHHQHNHPCGLHSLAVSIPVVPALNSLLPLREILAVEYKEPPSSFFQTPIWQPPRM